MLHITIPAVELWDEQKQQFVERKEQSLQLEHSLVSVKKWESKWHKPFLSNVNKLTDEETLDYVRCMTLTKNVDPETYDYLTYDNVLEIRNYIDNPMTATTFPGGNEKRTREIITSEIIYYWMINANIPFECQKWHLNSLITLIRVCNAKNAPAKKMSQREIMQRNAAINAARRQKTRSKG